MVAVGAQIAATAGAGAGEVDWLVAAPAGPAVAFVGGEHGAAPRPAPVPQVGVHGIRW